LALDTLTQTLVDSVQGGLVGDRFRDAALVNYDTVAAQWRGCFSLVFRATDEITGRLVALKFFDPRGLGDVYRLNAFHREHQILKTLLGQERCLQLASGLNKFELQVNTIGGSSFPLPCEYFAIEWIADDIDGYFLCQEKHSPIEKIALLVDIITAVQVLHAREVFHRDLKHDNLRACQRNGKRLIVPIDLGTAARFASSPIQNGYQRSVGAPAYAAPEARCGLAGNRLLAASTDVYALGCMLFELFNKDYFHDAYMAVNRNAHVHLAAMAAHLDLKADERAQNVAWNKAVKSMEHAFNPVQIDGPGSDVPPGIAPLLNELLGALTNVDYRARRSLAWARNRLLSVRAVLANEAAYQARLSRVREVRRKKIEALKVREQKLIQAQLRLKGATHANS
jgi:serine/threonine protein kinase